MATNKTSSKTKKTNEEETPIKSKKSETVDQVKKDTDALIDRIDDLIKDTNAEEFVQKYVQKGGE